MTVIQCARFPTARSLKHVQKVLGHTVCVLGGSGCMDVKSYFGKNWALSADTMMYLLLCLLDGVVGGVGENWASSRNCRLYNTLYSENSDRKK